MMKKTLFWMPLIAAMCVLLGCSNSTGGPTENSASYVSQDGAGNTYTLEITKNAAKAYVPVKGDNYVLTVKNPGGVVQYTSSGTVESNTGGALKLKHTDTDALPFTVTISDTGLMTKIGETGETIPVDPTEGTPNPDPVTPPAIYPKTDGSWLGESVFMPNQQVYNDDGVTKNTDSGQVEFDSIDLLVEIKNGVFNIKLDAQSIPSDELMPMSVMAGWYPGFEISDKTVQLWNTNLNLKVQGFPFHPQYRTETHGAGLWYVTKDVTIKGTMPKEDKWGGEGTTTIDLTLKKGWNWSIFDKDHNEEKTGVPGSDYKWRRHFGNELNIPE